MRCQRSRTGSLCGTPAVFSSGYPWKLNSGRLVCRNQGRNVSMLQRQLPAAGLLLNDAGEPMALQGKITVFLSCSEKFKSRVAIPVRNGLVSHGIKAIVLSDEPLLPHVEDNPDSKVDSYLDASDAFVALMTADDRLEDGTIRCRPNIVDEY